MLGSLRLNSRNQMNDCINRDRVVCFQKNRNYTNLSKLRITSISLGERREVLLSSLFELSTRIAGGAVAEAIEDIYIRRCCSLLQFQREQISNPVQEIYRIVT